MPYVCDPETVPPPESIPGLLREGFGSDHQGVEGQELASLAPLADRVGLRCSNHDIGRDPSVPALNHLRAQVFCRALLIDLDTETLAGRGQSASQPSGVDASTVRREGRSKKTLRPADEVGALVGGKKPDVLGAEPGTVLCLDSGAETLQLRFGGRHSERPRLLVAAVNAFQRHDAADLVDPVLDLALGSKDAVPTATSCVARAAAGDTSRNKTAIATGSAESRDLGLDHGDPQGRVGRLEIVRRPQPAESGSDDRDITRVVARKLLSRGQILDYPVEPQAPRPRVVGCRWRTGRTIWPVLRALNSKHNYTFPAHARRPAPPWPLRSCGCRGHSGARSASSVQSTLE